MTWNLECRDNDGAHDTSQARLFERLTGDEDSRCRHIPDEACNEQRRGTLMGLDAAASAQRLPEVECPTDTPAR